MRKFRMYDVPMDFAEILRRIMVECKLSVCGNHKSQISNWLNCKSLPNYISIKIYGYLTDTSSSSNSL
ncbi:MAG: hypothetical protein LBQ05_02610 [Christensenellaceae bacterium]|nr:hypothetical protein [Christensenellaceae bacterium]